VVDLLFGEKKVLNKNVGVINLMDMNCDVLGDFPVRLFVGFARNLFAIRGN